MQAITALAHLRAAILFVSDPSEQCGHSIEEQLNLFENIRPLFTNKPLLFVCNKTDIIRTEELPPPKKALYDSVINDPNITFLEMSTMSEEGIMAVKQQVGNL